MPDVTLSGLDIALVVAYLVLVTILGLWYSRGIHTSKDYFLGGRNLPWWAVGLSLVVSDVGAKDMVGLAADGYRHGIVMMNFDFLGCIFPVLVAAFLFMPLLWMAGVFTIPEYLGRRYNTGVRTLFAVIWTGFMVGTLGTIFVSAAVMFEVLLGWNFWFSVGVTAIVVGIYTSVGGLKAVVITDTVSCVILIVGAALICWYGLDRTGGWSGLQDKVAAQEWTEHHFQMVLPADHPDFAWPAVLLGLGVVLGPAYWIGNQAIVQRTLGTGSQSEARASYVFCAAVKMVAPVLFVLPGLIAIALFHDTMGAPDGKNFDQNGNRLLPMLVAGLLPSGIMGIVVGAFLAGILSNLDSYVNSATTLVVTDLYRPFIRPNASDRECLALGRWLVVVFLAAGAAASWLVRDQFKTVYEAFQTFMSLFQGALLSLLLLGILTRRATAAGGMAGALAGVGTSSLLTFGFTLIGFESAPSYLWVAWWSFAAAIAANVIVSLCTRPHDTERLRGLVWSLPERPEATNA